MRIKWNGIACVLGLMAVLSNMITLPLRGLVIKSTSLLDTPYPILIVDYFFDGIMLFVFLIQIILYHRQSRLIRRIWIECIAFLPLDLLAYGLNYTGNFSFFRLNHLLTIVPMLRYLRITEGHFWRMSVQKRRTMYILMILPMCSHWFACIWFYVAYLERDDIYAWNKQSLYPQYYNTSTTVVYLRSIYWSATMLTTVGFGDVTAVTRVETLIAIMVIYMGILLSCASIACVLKLMEHADRNQLALQERLDDVCSYLQWRNASSDLIDRSLAEVRATFVPQIETTRAELYKQLPHALRARLEIEHEEALVYAIPRFKNASKTLRNAISEHSVYVSKRPGDVLLKENQNLDGLYLLRRGEAACCSSIDPIVILKLFEVEEYIGEDALLSTEVYSPHALVCLTACEFVFLSRGHFQDMWQIECDTHPTEYDQDNDEENGLHHALARHSGTDSSSTRIRRRRCRVTSSDWMPNSIFRRVWTLICFGGLLYNIYAVPRDCAFFLTHNRFGNPDSEAIVDLVLFWTFDFLFFIDFFFNCRRFYIEHDGHIITDRKKINRRYLKSIWFWIDFISILPFDLFVLLTSMINLPFYRLNKIIRIFHLTEYFQVAEALLLSRFHVHVFSRRIFRIISILILSGYLVGCFWYYIAEITSFLYPSANWVYMDQINPNFYFQTYLNNRFYIIRSMYFGYIGGSTLGFGDIVPVNPYETFLATIMLLYGAILKPALVGGVASLLVTRNKTNVEQQKTLVGFKWLVSTHKLPDILKEQILNYFEFLWENESYKKENLIFEILITLKWEIIATLCRNINPKNWYFKDLNEDEMRLLYTKMKSYLILPHEEFYMTTKTLGILHVGHLIRLINEKIVEEINEIDSIQQRTFGIEFFLGLKPTSKIYANEYFCEILLLDAMDVEEIISENTWNNLIYDLNQGIFKPINKINLNNISPIFYNNKLNHIVPLADSPSTLQRSPSPKKNRSPYQSDPIQLSRATIERDVLSKSRFHPKSTFRKILNTLVIFALLYNAFLIPFRLAFFSSLEPASYFYGFLVDYILDFLFLIDIGVKYRYELLRLRDESLLSFNFHWNIIQQLKWDIISGFPIEFFLISILLNNPDFLIGILTICRIPKIFRLRYFIIRIKQITQTAIRSRPQWADFFIVCRYFLFILFFSHLLACGWHYLAFADKGIFPWTTTCKKLNNTNDISREETSCFFQGTWIEYQIHGFYLPKNGGTIWERYSRCFNYAIQMLLVVSSGVIVPVNMIETFFCIGAIFAGIFFSAGKIGVIGEIALKVDSVSSNIRQSTDALSKYLDFYKMPKNLQEKSIGFMEYLYRNRRQLLFQEDEIIDLLPEKLRDDIILHCKRIRLEKSILFSNLSLNILKNIANNMKQKYYSPGDIIVYADTYSRSMYFVKPGSVQYQDTSIPSSCSKKLAVFGARSLLFDESHLYTICSCTFSDIYILKEIGINNVFKIYPELKKQLINHLNIIPTENEIIKNYNHLNSSIINDNNIFYKNKNRSWKIPDSHFRRIWDGLLYFITLYIIIMIPLRITYLIEDRVNTLNEIIIWYGGDIIAQLLYCIDTYLSYNYFIFMDHSKLILNKIKIQENYKSYLYLDILSITPFSILSLFIGLPSLKFLMFPLLLRTKRFPRYLKRFSKNFQYYFFRLSGSMIHILHCILYYIIMIHWWACIWMFLHRYIEISSPNTWAVRDPYMGGGKLSIWNSETNSHNICTNMIDCYIRAYYFVITFIGTVGLGDIRTGGHLEYFFENIEALCGSFFFAALTSCFASYFQYADTFGRGAIQAKLSTIASYVRVAHTTKITTKAIVANTKLWCSRTGGLVENAVASYLPISLRVEMAQYIMRDLLATSDVLATCNIYIRDLLVLNLNFQVLCAGCTLYEAGESIDEIAFVNDGMVKLVSNQSNTSIILGEPGCHVGRAKEGPCHHTVIAIDHVELYVLDADGKYEVLGCLSVAKQEQFIELLDRKSLHNSEEMKQVRSASQRSGNRRTSIEQLEEEEVLEEENDDDEDSSVAQVWSILPQSLFK